MDEISEVNIPIIPMFSQEVKVNLELNAIDSNDDITGFRHIFGKQNLLLFTSIGSVEKTYYPRKNTTESPFELKLNLSKQTHFYS